ncbi:aspartyl protease family protein At5g10770-like isoform X2 [Phragmites australis]|uniref:aspartyl protease family protein At5g10770-like isoform X2 n=1 Tax=Phragmites australis TaxID=29695 RepID=UPI002D770FC8|nr:aspartyl protease family protein At5g10770-like isoform X2 [Phragmites australis]
MAWGARIAAALLMLLLATAPGGGGNGGGVHCMEEGSRRGRALRTRHHLRSRAESGATVLELRHHSFSAAPSKSREEEIDGLLSSDAARVSSLQWRIENYRLIRSSEEEEAAVAMAASKAQVPVTSGAKLRTLNYIATISLGGGEATVIVDTASELTWVQCKPCESCHDQQEPLFDPSSSPSYSTVPCNSSSCDALQVSAGMSGTTCGAAQPDCSYTLSYRDGSYSHGVLAHDKLSLAGEVIDGFVFGCGTSNQGAPFGGTSGLMGLGRSQLSMVSQTMDQFGGVFSYCLPLKESDSSGSLVLGDDSSVYHNSTPIVYTSMVSDPLQGPFYFLNLTGMTIGGQEVESSGFSAAKVIIDSGTIITSLVPSIYNAVKAEFLNQFAEYPQAPGFSILDTCFNMTGFREVQVPSLKLVFDGGVEVEVDSGGVLYFVSSGSSQVCLAMASLKSEYETSIIGNYQQKNLRVIFDTSGSQIGFAQETCDYI